MKRNFYSLFALITGLTVFSCSFYFEQEIIRHFINNDLVAVLLALALEGGKVLAIMNHYKGDEVSKKLASFFRFSLVGLSVLCSILYLSATLDRPNLERIKSERLLIVEKDFNEQLRQINNKFNDLRLSMKDQQHIEMLQVSSYYDKMIAQYDSLVLEEMDNTGKTGKFKGERYTELKAKREELEREYSEKREITLSRHAKQFESFDEKSVVAVEGLTEKFQGIKADIMNGKNMGIEVNDKYVIAFTSIFNALGLPVSPLQFVTLFSIFLSILMELCIILSFAALVKKESMEIIKEDEPEIFVESPKGKKVVLQWEKEQQRIKKLKNNPTITKRCNCSTWTFTDSRQKTIDEGRFHYACEACGKLIK